MNGLVATKRRAAVCAALLVASVPAVARSAPPAGAPCQAIDMAGSRWACAALLADASGAPSSLVVATSDDSGRTWRTVPSRGIAVTPSTVLGQVLLAPDDPAVYVQTNDGLYSSTDSGATFVLADRLAANTTAVAQLTRLVDGGVSAPALASGARFAYADPFGSPAVVQAPFHLPVAGSPDTEVRFLVPPSGPGDNGDPLLVALQRDASTGTPRSRPIVYGCDARLTCTESRFAFPYQSRYGGATLAPDYRRTGVAYVWTTDVSTGDLTVWRTADAGRTFAPWGPAATVTGPVNRAKAKGQGWDLSIAFDPRRPATMYVRAMYIRLASGGPPKDQVLRSDDGGRHWRVAGPLPWLGAGNVSTPYQSAVLVGPDGRLVVLAFGEGYQGVYCSTDRGGHWAKGCAA